MAVNLRRFLFSAILATGLMLSMVFNITKPVQASYFDNDGVIGADEVIDDDVFIGADQVIVDGEVNGFLAAAGNTVTINGVINGDAFLVGNQITVSKDAVITGNLFVGCQNATVAGEVNGSLLGGSASMIVSEGANIGRNVYYGGFSLETKPGTATGRDLYAGLYQAVLDGKIGRNANLDAGAVELNGAVGGDVQVDLGTSTENELQTPPTFFFPGMGTTMPAPIKPGLRVSPEAKIGGKLVYTASFKELASINAKPANGIVYQTPVPIEVKQAPETSVATKVSVISPFVKWLLDTLRNLVTLLILGGLALWLLPELLRRLVEQVKAKPAPSAGYGFVVVVIGYAAAFFAALVILLVGIIFMVITLGGLGKTIFTVGFSGIALALAIFGLLVGYGSKLVLAYLGGDWILKQLAPQSSPAKIWAMVIGVVIYTLLRSIPLIGWLFGLLATLFGIGAMWLLYRQWRSSRLAPAPVEV